jgi:hypothetical protein
MAEATGATPYSNPAISLNSQKNIDVSTTSAIDETVYLEAYYLNEPCMTFFSGNLKRHKLEIKVVDPCASVSSDSITTFAAAMEISLT